MSGCKAVDHVRRFGPSRCSSVDEMFTSQPPATMFRPLTIASTRSMAFAPTISIPQHFRLLNCSAVALKKKGKKAEVSATSDSTEPPRLDMDELSNKLQLIVDNFVKQASEYKMGKTNPQIFDHLQIKTADGDLPYTAIAQTTIKGRNFLMTVFDPANVSNVINSVLASNLNLNPIADPSNKHVLKIPIPPVTTESKKDRIKELKAAFEKFKNGPGGSGKNAGTLSAVRADVKNKVAKKKKMTDAEQALWNDYEKLHKKYVDKLNDTFKAAETAILK